MSINFRPTPAMIHAGQSYHVKRMQEHMPSMHALGYAYADCSSHAGPCNRQKTLKNADAGTTQGTHLLSCCKTVSLCRCRPCSCQDCLHGSLPHCCKSTVTCTVQCMELCVEKAPGSMHAFMSTCLSTPWSITLLCKCKYVMYII